MTDWKPIAHFHQNRNETPRFVLIWVGEFVIAEHKRNRKGEEWWETEGGATDDCYQRPTHYAIVTTPH